MENKANENFDYGGSENSEVMNLISQPYKYGFSTKVETEEFPKGINEDIVKLISIRKNEPQFLLDFRLKAYRYWIKMTAPEWACINYNEIDYNSILYYSAPKKAKELSSLDEVDPNILDTFEKLGIPFLRRGFSPNKPINVSCVRQSNLSGNIFPSSSGSSLGALIVNVSVP